MSKYSIDVKSIRTMSEKEIDNYIRKALPVINSKYRRMKKLGRASKFSEFVNDYNEISSMFHSDKLNLSAIKGATITQKKHFAYGINRLASISETPKQVKDEYDNNVKDKFEIMGLPSDIKEEEFIKYVKDNFSFVYEILGSDRVNELSNESENMEDFYHSGYKEYVDTLNKFYDEDEIENIISEWSIPNIGD